MRRKQQAAVSRAGLLKAARECFVERGYERTTVAAILERAGMARGALYHYFPGGKREIFGAVFDGVNHEFHDRRDGSLALASPLARIRAGIHRFLELCSDDHFARIALLEAPRLVPGQDRRGSSYHLLREQVEEAAAAGELRGVHAEVAATALYGAARAAGELASAAPDRDRAVADAIRCLDLLLDGLAAPPRAEGER